MLIEKRSIIEYTSIKGLISKGVVVSNNACMRYSPTFQVVPLRNSENTYIAEPKKEVLIEREQVLTVLGLMRFKEIKEICDGILEHHLAKANDRFKIGEIWNCDIPKEDGSIQYGKRPVLISSAEVVDDMIHIIPLTSQMKKLEQPTHVLLTKEESKFLTDYYNNILVVQKQKAVAEVEIARDAYDKLKSIEKELMGYDYNINSIETAILNAKEMGDLETLEKLENIIQKSGFKDFLWVWRESTGCSSRGPEFNSQQPHGGSQPSEMGSDALFCHAGEHADIHKINNF